MTEFYVADFRVDMARSQIVAEQNILCMEPKVLQVLLILAQHQGEVVSHDVLLEKVWPGVVVAPNALQRCIAQLRKAFGDDARRQEVIATHPKVGYSLVANVDWAQQASQELPVSLNETPTIIKPGVWIMVVLLAFLSGSLLWSGLSTEQQSPLFSHMTPLTTTDNKEFYPAFSPDGKYIAFMRFTGFCDNQLWVKALDTRREFLLTEKSGAFGPPAWSPDGSRLAFSNYTKCTYEQPRSGCRELRSVSVTLGMSVPQPTQLVKACDRHDFGGINWLDNDTLAFAATRDNEGSIKTLRLSDNHYAELFALPGQMPYALSYSANHNRLVMTFHDTERNVTMLTLDPHSGKTETVPLSPPESFKDYVWWDATWHPHEPRLIMAARDTLFEVDMQGNFSENPIATIENLHHPVFHPYGERIAATMGILDRDVGLFDLTNPAQHQVLHRSIVEDFSPRFRPGSEGVSFISRRSGTEQLWLSEQGQLLPLGPLPGQNRIDGYVWSHDGSMVALAVGGLLNILHPQGQPQTIETPFKVLSVMQWLPNNEVLLKVVKDSQRKVVAFDVGNKTSRRLYSGFSHRAQLAADGTLYLMTKRDALHVLKPGMTEPQLLETGFAVEGFSLKNGQLYAQNRQADVKRWVGETQQWLTLPKPDDEGLLRMEDIDETAQRGLFTRLHSARKEIVLLHH